MQGNGNRSTLWMAGIVFGILIAGTSFAQPQFDANRAMNDGTQSAPITQSPLGDLPTPRHYSRIAPVLLSQYLSFDNWNLDTGCVRDINGDLQFTVRLWEYDNRNPHFDRYVINPAGEVVDTALDWIGVGDQCVVTVAEKHHFLNPSATTQWFGETDSQNNIHVFYTNMQSTGWEIVHGKLGPTGNTLIAERLVTTGADCWNWYLQPIVLSDDTLAVVWGRDTEDICAIVSTDGGANWSEIITLIDRTNAPQLCCPKAVVAGDDSIQLVWRTLNWETSIEKLWYAHVLIDGTILVDESSFYTGPCWYPFASLDDYGNVNVTFSDNYQGSTDVYYTRLNGNLDLNGAPASESMLTLIPERSIVTDPDTVHYPQNLVDANGAVHVVYEEGAYGRDTDKDLYYVRICGVIGDLDCDEDVELNDLAALLSVYGVCEGEPGFNEIGADFNGNGCVDLSDLAALLANYGYGS